MAAPACSSDPTTTASNDGGGAKDSPSGSDAEADTGGGPADAQSEGAADGGISDALAAADACLNRPGDCSHGLCSW